MNCITEEEWNTLSQSSVIDQSLKRKCNEWYTHWIRHLKKTNQLHLMNFLSKAYKSHRIQEKKHDKEESLCLFSSIQGELIQGYFIYLEDNTWKKSKIYIYQHTYTILARTCMILGDLMTFFLRWKQDEETLPFQFQNLNSFIQFTDKFIKLQ